MATIRLIPSTYSLSNTQYLSISNASNMYNNTDNTTYATVSNTRNNSNTSYYIYINGFNFDDVPSNATVNSFTIKFKAYESNLSTSTSYRPYLVNGTTATSDYASTMPGTSAQTITFDNVSSSWETLSGYGDNFGIRITLRKTSTSGGGGQQSSTTGYLYVYGAEILVDYSLPTKTVTTSVENGEATIDPEGSSEVEEGTSFTLTINAENKPTVLDNGVDVTDQLIEKTTSGGSVSAVPASYTTGGNITGTYYTSCIGQGSDTSSSTTSNCYCSNSGSTTYIDYSFDLSSVPSNATITSVSCSVNGHCESTSSSSEVATCQLYAGSTAKGSATSFTTTSNSTITLTCGTWTRTELDSLVLRFTIGYYGGLINGATVTVVYEVDSSTTTYTYTLSSVTENHTILVYAVTDDYYVKVNGTWKKITSIYIKIDNDWVKQSNYELDQTLSYIYKGTV